MIWRFAHRCELEQQRKKGPYECINYRKFCKKPREDSQYRGHVHIQQIINGENQNDPSNVPNTFKFHPLVGATLKITFPSFVIDFLEIIKIPNITEYKGVELEFMHQFLPFTKGIELNDKEFDIIARRALFAVLKEYERYGNIYRGFDACHLGFIIDKLILKLLKNPKFHTPNEVIDCLTECAKLTTFSENFTFLFQYRHRTVDRMPFIYNYWELDEKNPAKMSFDHFEDISDPIAYQKYQYPMLS